MANDLKNTEAFIRKYGKEVVDEIKNRLVGAGKKATGKLIKSIRFEVKKELDITFKMADYGQYVDKGVSGAGIPDGFKGKLKPVVTSGKFKFRNKMPPDNKSMRDWMKIKGIPKKASFPVRRSIWIFGISPTNFFTIPTTRRQKQFNKGVEENMAKDFDILLQKELNKK